MFFLFLVFFFIFGCVPPKPILVYQSPTVGDGGKLVREIYRSTWTMPSSDQDLIRIGIVEARPQIRFRAMHPMRIRALGESSSWEVSSPEGVNWVVESQSYARPGVISYFSTISQRYVKRPPKASDPELLTWKNRGFLSTRWLGPPKMDIEVKNSHFERWMIALTPPTTKEIAQKQCATIKEEFQTTCYAVARIEIPPLARGRVWAENSTFSKDFEGFVELISPHGPIQIEDLSQNIVTGESSTEIYGPKLLIVPSLEKNLTLIQQTSLQNYLEGVVASEIFSRSPDEALKAQAIVARTYTLRFGKPDQVLRPYFICAGTQCQAYRGIENKDVGPSKAVEETMNRVLISPEKKLAITYYHSICGGRTDSRKTIFGESSVPYLEGVSDFIAEDAPALKTDSDISEYLKAPARAYCGLSTFTVKDRWRWNETLDEEKLTALSESLGLTQPLKDVVVLKRGDSGRVTSIEFRSASQKKRLEGELLIRKTLGGLRSAQFVLEFKRRGEKLTEMTILGGAGGHGVGMCQVGAIGRAEHGQTATQILQTYFPGTFIDDFSNVVVE